METRNNLRTRIGQLISSRVVLVCICFASLVSIGFAQEAVTSSEQPVLAADANKAEVLSFPYFAQITDDGVNIRSGPGTNYYSCGKLNKTDKVKVVGRRFSWSCIVPSTGCFSWVSRQYIDIDKNEPNIGIVTGDGVRVYAGSEELKPMRSEYVHFTLSKGDKVQMLGQELDDYYKIVPPAGAYLYVSTQYTKPLMQVPAAIVPRPEAKTETVPKPAAMPKSEAAPLVKPEIKPVAEVNAPVVVPTRMSVEAEKLKEYNALKEQIGAQRAKPLDQQNYTNIKKAVLEIANNKEAGKAARYCEFLLKQIERFELAQEVNKEVGLQDTQLQSIRDGIEKARDRRLAEVPELGRFAIMGRFQISNVYGAEAERKHYLIMDDSGKIVCYARPVGPAASMDLSKFIGQKVGLVGTIQPHQQTSGALIQFTEIVKLK